MWWCTPIIPAFRRLRQEDLHEFEASLNYIVRTCLKKKQKTIYGRTTLSVPDLTKQTKDKTKQKQHGL